MMANQAGLAALFFKLKFPQISYLLTLQEGDSEWDIWLRTWFMRPLYKAIYRRADYIQTISNFLANRARKMGAKCPVEVVPNGVIIKNDELRIKNSNLKRVISVSRLVKKNSLEDLVKALVIVNRSSDNPVILKIIGEGKLRSKLEKLIRKLGINNSTIIKKSDKEEKVLEGKVVNKQVYEYLKQADIFVRPSLSEGLGNSFLEAMAMRVPVIGTPVGGIPDFLKDGETGWFCKVKDPQSIAEKINYILDEKNQAEVERVVENAYKLVTEKYTWPKIAEQMNTIFVQLTGKNKK
jgi:glycosyltransferase involved in cell wall biosynthesis